MGPRRAYVTICFVFPTGLPKSSLAPEPNPENFTSSFCFAAFLTSVLERKLTLTGEEKEAALPFSFSYPLPLHLIIGASGSVLSTLSNSGSTVYQKAIFSSLPGDAKNKWGYQR